MPASVEYLTADQIRRFHEEAITETGGMPGVRSDQALFSALMQPQASAFQEDAYPTVAEKAAAYGFFLNQSHPFNDGNKRTAVIAMLAFLDLNSYDFDETDDEITEAFVGVAAKTVDQGQFFQWVVEHAHPVTGNDARD